MSAPAQPLPLGGGILLPVHLRRRAGDQNNEYCRSSTFTRAAAAPEKDGAEPPGGLGLRSRNFKDIEKFPVYIGGSGTGQGRGVEEAAGGECKGCEPGGALLE